jgi:hypothetical protein
LGKQWIQKDSHGNIRIVSVLCKTNQKPPKYTKALRVGSGLSENNFLGPYIEGEPAKNFYNKLERLAVSCRVTWALSYRVNLYS